MKKMDVLIITALVIMGALIALLSSADKPTAALTVFALVMASVTIWVSIGASEETSRQTERALEITQNTALKTHRQTERSLKMTELTLRDNRNRTKNTGYKRKA